MILKQSRIMLLPYRLQLFWILSSLIPSAVSFVSSRRILPRRTTTYIRLDPASVSFSETIDSIGRTLETTDSLPLIGIGSLVAFLAFTVPPAKILDDSSLRQVVAGTFLAGKPLKIVYKGSKDGWSAVNFHGKVDNLGSAVIVARTLSGKVVGGFNPNGWRSSDDYYGSTAAFLFTKTSKGIRKYPVISGGGANAAVFDYATGGACFGTEDFLLGPPKAAIMGGFAGPDMENVSMNAGDLRQGVSNFAVTYGRDREWPVRGRFTAVEVEVYCQDR